MTEKSWTEAKIESIDEKISKQDQLLEKLVDGFNKLASHEERIDIVESNMSDHETRIRDIEKYKWILLLISALVIGFMTYFGKISADMIAKAQEQQPITEQQLEKILEKTLKKSNDQ